MTKQIYRAGVLLLLLATVALTGCSAQRKIEGTWTATTSESRMGVSVSSLQTFVLKPDNTMSINHHFALAAGSVDTTETATYKLDGQSLDCTLTSASVSTKSSIPGMTPTIRTVPLNVVMVYTWALKDSDTLDLTMTSVTRGQQSSTVTDGTMVELKKQS